MNLGVYGTPWVRVIHNKPLNRRPRTYKVLVDLIDLHTGVGYAINLYKGLYINPWVGLSIHLNAPKEVNIGAEIWNPRKLILFLVLNWAILFKFILTSEKIYY
jgi:hypothetical protein